MNEGLFLTEIDEPNEEIVFQQLTESNLEAIEKELSV